MPFAAPLFANVYNANFGSNVPGGETQGDAGKGWNSDNDNAGLLLKNGIVIFAASMVPGFLPGIAIPPASPPPIDSVFSVGDAGADALTMGMQFGAILASWFPTGTFIIPGVPPIGPLPWI